MVEPAIIGPVVGDAAICVAPAIVGTIMEDVAICAASL